MLVCGMKLTHDGAVALIEDRRLVASVEIEKLDNRPRYSELGDLANVERVLSELGYSVGDVESFVVDGWGYGERDPRVSIMSHNVPVDVRVAPYREFDLEDDSLAAYKFDGLPLSTSATAYSSFHHTTGHILAAYCTSPFAAAGEPSFVLVWDGGVLPRFYYVTPDPPSIESMGPIFGLMGNVYPKFAMRFAPFRLEDLGGTPERQVFHQLTVPGKVMAYTAMGKDRDDLRMVLDDIYDSHLSVSMDFASALADEFLCRTSGDSVSSADALATFQSWVGDRLLQSLAKVRDRYRGRVSNLCLSGGCALNIKWNSKVRASGLFDHVWVPPFPNDSGSAIGTASAEMFRTGNAALEWSVYSGPMANEGEEINGYIASRATVTDLARLLHTTGEPVVIMNGRAELGPRALGNRSILAPAVDPAMKNRLNYMKGREYYRPVSPICLEDRAPDIFDPGIRDPFMLFEHRVRPNWVSRIPAVIHLDGSARLQTVSDTQNPTITALLNEYERMSGIPLLCNTSANFSGSGFFPDIASAARWGRAPYIWMAGTLWSRPQMR